MYRRISVFVLLVIGLMGCSTVVALVLDHYFELKQDSDYMTQGMAGGACVVLIVILFGIMFWMFGLGLKKVERK